MEVLSQKREADRVASRPSPPGLPGGPGHPPLPVPLAHWPPHSHRHPRPPTRSAGCSHRALPSGRQCHLQRCMGDLPSRHSPRYSPPTPHTSGASWYRQPLSQQNEAPPAAAHSRPSECLQRERPKDSLGLPRLHSPSEGAPTGLRREKETAVNGRGSGVCPTPRLRNQGPSSPTARSLPLGESASLGAHIGSLLAHPPGRAGARGPAASTPGVLGPRLQSDTDQSTASSRCSHPAQPNPLRASPTAGATSLPRIQGAHVKGGKTFPRDLPARRAGPGPAKPLARLKSH